MKLYFLNLTNAGNALIDYGVLGIVVLAVGYFAWHLFKTQQKYAEGWREEAKEMSKAFIQLSTKQAMIDEKQAEIQERQMNQQQHNHEETITKLDKMESKIIEEIKVNVTPRV
jgi:hypothetical protein